MRGQSFAPAEGTQMKVVPFELKALVTNCRHVAIFIILPSPVCFHWIPATGDINRFDLLHFLNPSSYF